MRYGVWSIDDNNGSNDCQWERLYVKLLHGNDLFDRFVSGY